MLCTARWRGEPAVRSDDGSAELSWRVCRQVEVDNPALPRVPEPIVQWTEIWRVRWVLHDHVPVHDGSQIFHGLFADVARCVVLLPNVVRPQVGGMGQNGGQVLIRDHGHAPVAVELHIRLHENRREHAIKGHDCADHHARGLLHRLFHCILVQSHGEAFFRVFRPDAIVLRIRARGPAFKDFSSLNTM